MRKRKQAFTLIELLVVVAIISALVGILSVAQKKVKYHARTLRQKAEFHGMDISLELFHSDFRDYPDSDVVDESGVEVSGAQRLAEAMLGRDEEGFHPKTKWHPAKEAAEAPPLVLYDNMSEDTRAERKGPYFELKHSDLMMPDDMWGSLTGGAGSLQATECPVLTDVFTFNKVTDTNGENIKIGSPVLYFKAEPTKRFRVDHTRRAVTNPTPVDYNKWVYDLDDNIDILNLNWLREDGIAGDTTHYSIDPDSSEKADPGNGTMESQYFYEFITQREDTDRDFFKSYNKDTYILLSAGWDGIFGTKDDVGNFDF